MMLVMKGSQNSTHWKGQYVKLRAIVSVSLVETKALIVGIEPLAKTLQKILSEAIQRLKDPTDPTYGNSESFGIVVISFPL